MLYHTQHNNRNRFSPLATVYDDEDDGKITVINNKTPNKMEAECSTSVVKITNKEAIADAGATELFSYQEYR